jgi:hypothetical protein
MSSELLPPDAGAALSPKVRFLQEHNLITRQLASGRWECLLDEENIARGEDEQDAIISYCIKSGLKHWRTP